MKGQTTNRKHVNNLSIAHSNYSNIFSSIKPSQLLAEYNPQKFKTGDCIFLPEERSNKLYFITEGIVKIGIYPPSGKSVTKAILREGELFGMYTLSGINKHPYFAMAWKEVTISIIPIEAIKKMIQHNSDLAFFLLQKMRNKILEKEKLVNSIVFENARTRIIEFLIHLAKVKGVRVGYEKLVRHMMTHQEIADLTATSRQTVTTTLSELRKKNILKMDRKRMLVRSMEELSNAI